MHRPRPRRLAALAAAALTLLGCASAGAKTGSAPVPRESPNASLCDMPPLDTTAFNRFERGGFSVGVPRGYTMVPGGVGVDYGEFRSGVRRIVLTQGNYPMLFNDGEVPTLLRSSCTANIDGWPVEVVLITYDVATARLNAPDQVTGMHFVVGARWSHALGGRDLAMWVDTKDPAISRRLRAMFWTVHFKGDTTAAGGRD